MPSLFKKLFGRKDKNKDKDKKKNNSSSVPSPVAKPSKKKSSKLKKSKKKANDSSEPRPLQTSHHHQNQHAESGVPSFSREELGNFPVFSAPKQVEFVRHERTKEQSFEGANRSEGRAPVRTVHDENRDFSNGNSHANGIVEYRARSVAATTETPASSHRAYGNYSLPNQNLTETPPKEDRRSQLQQWGGPSENASDCVYSPTSSTEMCFSTDADDDEYNKMRAGSSLLGNGLSSPDSDSTEEYVLFPGLSEENEASASNEIVPMRNETEEQLRAWTPSPPKMASVGGGNDVYMNGNGSPKKFSFEGDDSGNNQNQNQNSRRKSKPPCLYPDSTDSEFEGSGPLAGEALVSTESNSGNESPKDKEEFRNAHSSSLADNISPTSLDSKSKARGGENFAYFRSSDKSRRNRVSSPNSPRKLSHRGRPSVTPSPSPESEHIVEFGKPSSPRSNAKLKRKKRRKDGSANVASPLLTSNTSSDGSNDDNENFLFDEVTQVLGPRGVAHDAESISGRSNRSGRSKTSTGAKSHRSSRSHRSHRSTPRSHKSRSRRHHSSNASVGSRNSQMSHRSTRSALSHMSDASRSVANDLLRLEMQLAMVGSEDPKKNSASSVGGNSRTSYNSYGSNYMTSASVGGDRHRTTRNKKNKQAARRNRLTINAPPGKLGIILANKFDSKGTVISGVRSSSVLSNRLFPGDRIVAIDGEDVSRMTVSEITTIMARKNDFERTLTILTTKVEDLSSQPIGEQQGLDMSMMTSTYSNYRH